MLASIAQAKLSLKSFHPQFRVRKSIAAFQSPLSRITFSDEKGAVSSLFAAFFCAISAVTSLSMECAACNCRSANHLFQVENTPTCLCNGRLPRQGLSHLIYYLLNHRQSVFLKCSTNERIQCQTCSNPSLFVLGHVQRSLLCIWCVIAESQTPAELKHKLLTWRSLVQDGQLDPAFLRPPRVDKAKRVGPIPRPEFDGPTLTYSFDSPESYQTAFRCFVEDERRREIERHRNKNCAQIAINWRSPTELRFHLPRDRFLLLGRIEAVQLFDDETPVGAGKIAALHHESYEVEVTLDAASPAFQTKQLQVHVDHDDVVYRNQLDALAHFDRLDGFYQSVLLGGVSQLLAPIPPPADVFPGRLTAEQAAAVGHSLAHRLGFVEGVAGTGKTLCAVHQAISLARSGRRVLLISVANDSVDNLARKVRESGWDDARRLYAQSARHIIPPDLAALALPDRDLSDDQGREFREVKIVVTTVSSLHRELFRQRSEQWLIVDDANRLSDPELVTAFALNPVGVTLWGDPKQLQPFSHNDKVYEKGYTMSLLERVGYIAAKEGVAGIPLRLKTQHRMRPELAKIPVSFFYREEDEVGNAEMPLQVPDLSGTDLGNPLTFVDVRETWEVRSDDGLSFFNVKETVVAASFVDRFWEAGVGPEKIAILAFYDGEVTFAKRVLPKICEAPQEYLNGLIIQTVDASEGKDFEVVIVVCVRTNRGGNRGFLKRERLLVALTRARFQLLIVGDFAMWKTIDNDGWVELLDYCTQRKLVRRFKFE